MNPSIYLLHAKLRFNVFEAGLIISIVSLNILEIILSGEINWMGTIASIAGVLSVALAAKGHIACYFFGFIQVVLYVFISWKSKFYGEVMLNGLYFMPMQVIGFFTWQKKLGKQDLVKARSMKCLQRFLLFGALLVCALACGWCLEYLDGKAPYLDAISTILSVAAMLLMVRAFLEQWVLWIAVNAATICKWLIAFMDKEPYALVMIMMWSLFLINSIYGFLNWKKLAKKDFFADRR